MIDAGVIQSFMRVFCNWPIGILDLPFETASG
jgi:hypothetical protein